MFRVEAHGAQAGEAEQIRAEQACVCSLRRVVYSETDNGRGVDRTPEWEERTKIRD